MSLGRSYGELNSRKDVVMSNPNIPPMRVPRDGSPDDPVTTEVDGETRLDPDVNDDLIDSASADRLAADDDLQEGTT